MKQSQLLRARAYDTHGVLIRREVLVMLSISNQGVSVLLVIGVESCDGPDNWFEYLEDPFVAFEYGEHSHETLAGALAHLVHHLERDETCPIFELVRNARFTWVDDDKV